MKYYLVALAALTLYMGLSGFAAAANPTLISKCGFTIMEPGFYQASANLSSAQGLTRNGDCIDIFASGVFLDLDDYTVTGPGLSPTTRSEYVGIHVFEGAAKVFLEANSGQRVNNVSFNSVAGWTYGVENEADRFTLDNFEAQGNQVGVLVKGAKNSTITDLLAFNNTKYGVWLIGSSQIQVTRVRPVNNADTGVEVGCREDDKPVTFWHECHEFSNHNAFFNINPAGSPQQPQQYGVRIEGGNSDNLVTNIYTGGDSQFDLFDGNPDCGGNLWVTLPSLTRNRTCVH